VTPAPDTLGSRRDSIVFALCLLLSVVARLAPPAVQAPIADAIVHSVLAPFLYLQEQTEVIRASRSRYLATVGLRDSVLTRAMTVEGLELENQRLRSLLGLSRRLAVRHVSAELLQQALPTASLVARLSVGEDAGVAPGAPVITPQGLLGVVQSVSRSQSLALLWTHPDFRVSAMTRDGAVFGIAAPRGGSGPNATVLELRGVPYQQEVPLGTAVYTSGLGGTDGVYPRGIPVGTIIDIGEEQEGWSRTYIVRAAVAPASVSHAIILTGPAVDIRSAFSEAEGIP
jgi:rod shape-determining protein MreC